MERSVATKTASEVRANLKTVLDTVTRDRTPVIISRRKHEAVVMIPLSEWQRWQDDDPNAHVSAEDRRLLLESIAQAERGELVWTEWNGQRFVATEPREPAE